MAKNLDIVILHFIQHVITRDNKSWPHTNLASTLPFHILTLKDTVCRFTAVQIIHINVL